MKRIFHRSFGAAMMLAMAARGGELTTSAVDGGGGIVSGGTVEATGSLRDVGDFSGDAGSITVRSECPGQLYDPVELTVTPGGAEIVEFGTAKFAAQFRCDDDSLLPAPVDVWTISSPFASVSPEGVVQVNSLPGDQLALLTATSGAFQNTVAVQLHDGDPDNYGPWAADGIPDEWQALYFTGQEANGVPAADPDGDGQDNRTEYLAGTDPLDPASFLSLRFGPDPAPGVKLLTFMPYLPGHTYALEWSASLDSPWTVSAAAPAAGSLPGEGAFAETSGDTQRRFYRLRITVP